MPALAFLLFSSNPLVSPNKSRFQFDGTAFLFLNGLRKRNHPFRNQKASLNISMSITLVVNAMIGVFVKPKFFSCSLISLVAVKPSITGIMQVHQNDVETAVALVHINGNLSTPVLISKA
ncbi:hypothetical protein OH492_17570 [Vibrio chagasii]|nr:hypothetical protein [Vibrio chagasii]